MQDTTVLSVNALREEVTRQRWQALTASLGPILVSFLGTAKLPIPGLKSILNMGLSMVNNSLATMDGRQVTLLQSFLLQTLSDVDSMDSDDEYNRALEERLAAVVYIIQEWDAGREPDPEAFAALAGHRAPITEG